MPVTEWMSEEPAWVLLHCTPYHVQIQEYSSKQIWLCHFPRCFHAVRCYGAPEWRNPSRTRQAGAETSELVWGTHIGTRSGIIYDLRYFRKRQHRHEGIMRPLIRSAAFPVPVCKWLQRDQRTLMSPQTLFISDPASCTQAWMLCREWCSLPAPGLWELKLPCEGLTKGHFYKLSCLCPKSSSYSHLHCIII